MNAPISARRASQAAPPARPAPIPRNPWCNVYLHDIRKSDDDRAFHDHPWFNTSFLIEGRYIEHTPEGSIERKAGDFVSRGANQLHRLEVIPGESAISLFITGPKVREWGFECPQGWVHWKDFTDENDSSQVGRGPKGKGDAAPRPTLPPQGLADAGKHCQRGAAGEIRQSVHGQGVH